MKTNKNLLKEISKVIELEDNSCLVDLYGEHDENLSKLENNFGIHISYRGNILEFRGESEPCLEASQLVLKVYKKLLSGEKINSEMFDNFSKKDILASAERLNTILIKTKKKNIYSRSSNQSKFVELIKSKDLVFGVGPAGTGKTYLAVACAVESLLKKDINKIILSRPAVEAGERLGFLPGDLKEKIDPYLRPLYDAMNDLIPEKILLFSFKALSNKKLTEISVRLTGDEEIKLLNKQYRDKNSSTNVLSFPSLNVSIHPEANEMLGDIVISKDTVLREAKNSKKSFEQHLSHLGIHGLLHLMGFSHDKENEALIMEGIEVKILKDLGIPNPYEGVI